LLPVAAPPAVLLGPAEAPRGVPKVLLTGVRAWVGRGLLADPASSPTGAAAAAAGAGVAGWASPISSSLLSGGRGTAAA
jgi:hypothetical protein